jgi:hypothetical protein
MDRPAYAGNGQDRLSAPTLKTECHDPSIGQTAPRTTTAQVVPLAVVLKKIGTVAAYLDKDVTHNGVYQAKKGCVSC